MELTIKPLTPEPATEYLEFFDRAQTNGGGTEAYPVLRERREPLDFTGPVGLYEKAGFVRVDRRGDTLVMRKKLK